MPDYKPNSHFFVDHSNLANSAVTDLAADAYGPVSGALTTKYRTTSFVRASALTKVFAICDGQIMIQPQTGDDTKVNLILKPSASASYAPIKIKYFIYRGINKSDLIGNNILKAVNTSDPNQPTFLKKLWKEFIDFNMPFYNQGIINTPPETFPASLIGYNESQLGNTLIEHYFRRNNDGGNFIFYQIPSCIKGEHIGNFTGRIGLDVVLDYGDYELTNQDELFKLNLDFARKTEHIFDIATIPTSTPTKIKRFKEYIHQFLDAAAFWGSHNECGKILTISAPTGITSAANIFTNILNKYQTKYKIYVHVQSERLRSYNYFDATRRIYGFAIAGQLNENNGWPIIIEELTLSSTTITFKELKNIELEYSISSTIHPEDRQIIVDVISPNNNTSIYPKIQRPGNPTGTIPPILTGRTEQININFSVNGTKSCAAFLFLYANLKQEFPLKAYFNELWTVNLATSLSLPLTDANLVHWLNYDRNKTINLDDVLQIGAVVQNKVVFDNGLNTGPIAPSPLTKKRRTYLVGMKSNTSQNSNYDTASFTAGFEKNIPDSNIYSIKLYNDNNYIIYKGKFVDNLTSAVISSLTLFNNNDYTKKFSFLHLGITEEEFNKLMYDSPTVPPIVPPNIEPPQILPRDADNVFFYLDEISGFNTPNVRKFRVGLQYEDNAGVLQILYPSTVNTVHIYTMDGYLFCSSEYADYQEFYTDFPKCKIDFRVTQPYAGEFGFDWMRIGDTLAPGDIDYKDHVGKLYSDAAHTNIEMNTNTYSGYFLKKPELYKKLELEYHPLPMQSSSGNNIERYYVPILTIYPPYIVPTPPTPDLDRQSVFTSPFDDDVNRLAQLTLKIEVTSEPVRLELDYDSTKFNITPTVIPKTVTTGSTAHTLNISVRCLTEFGTDQQIKVKAYYNDSPIGKTVGIIRVKPNSKLLRRSKKILLINVHTNIAGAVTPPALIFNIQEQAKFLKKFVRQALSTPIMETKTIDLIANPDVVFNNDFVGTTPSGNKFLRDQNAGGQYIIQYLYDYITTIGPSPVGTAMYADYFKVFFFNDNGINGRYGFSLSNLNLLADFTNNLPSTTTHEFLHTAKAPHTFANYEGTTYAKFTYQPSTTDSIMDYSDFAGPTLTPPLPLVPTISLYDWQCKVVKEEFDPEP